MKIHVLNGFLGSGKTTAIRQACRELIQKGISVGAITNDQGIKLVDGDFFQSLQIPSRQVVNGCFCCKYDQLEEVIQSLTASCQPGVIFAESVGSCTDIVATVMKPLQRFHPLVELSFSVFADARLLRMILVDDFSGFDESVKYIYEKQLEEAPVIVINKTDLLQDPELNEIRELMKEKFPGKILVWQNSLDAESVHEWLAILEEHGFSRSPSSLKLDYDIYGSGEAKLAWVDQEMTLYSPAGQAIRETVDLMRNIYERIRSSRYPIGHLKFLINGREKYSFTNVSGPGEMHITIEPADETEILMNARVQTEPEKLVGLVSESIEEACRNSGCKIVVNHSSAFRPGYPRPTHRMV